MKAYLLANFLSSSACPEPFKSYQGDQIDKICEYLKSEPPPDESEILRKLRLDWGERNQHMEQYHSRRRLAGDHDTFKVFEKSWIDDYRSNLEYNKWWCVPRPTSVDWTELPLLQLHNSKKQLDDLVDKLGQWINVAQQACEALNGNIIEKAPLIWMLGNQIATQRKTAVDILLTAIKKCDWAKEAGKIKVKHAEDKLDNLVNDVHDLMEKSFQPLPCKNLVTWFSPSVQTIGLYGLLVGKEISVTLDLADLMCRGDKRKEAIGIPATICIDGYCHTINDTVPYWRTGEKSTSLLDWHRRYRERSLLPSLQKLAQDEYDRVTGQLIGDSDLLGSTIRVNGGETWIAYDGKSLKHKERCAACRRQFPTQDPLHKEEGKFYDRHIPTSRCAEWATLCTCGSWVKPASSTSIG